MALIEWRLWRNCALANVCNGGAARLSLHGREHELGFLFQSGHTPERRFHDRPHSGAMSNSHSRPQPAGRGYVSISAGGAPGDRGECPVFGEQIVALTASSRPLVESGKGTPEGSVCLAKQTINGVKNRIELIPDNKHICIQT